MKPLKEFEERALAWGETPHFESYLGRYRIVGVQVEVMGDLRIKGGRQEINLGSGSIIWQKRQYLFWQGKKVPLIPLEVQAICNLILKKERGYQSLALLRERGFDRELVQEFIKEQEMGRAMEAKIWKGLEKEPLC